MKQKYFSSLSYDDVMQIEGRCGMNTMTVKEYAEGGYFDSSFGKMDDFLFEDGGFITVIDDKDNLSFGYAAIFVDENGLEETFNLMF